MNNSPTKARVDCVRRFNRFFTRRIGVLREGLVDSPYSLTEVRVLYELAQSGEHTAAQICQVLDLDPGYLSRIVRRFTREGLLEKRKSDTDARQILLDLTEKGKDIFAQLDQRSHDEIVTLLRGLSEDEQLRLTSSMRTIENLLGAGPAEQPDYRLRRHVPGDIGWVVWRHGVLYSREYGWNAEFEALVAEIAAEFIQNYDAQRDRCWIAERGGSNVGCVFLVKESEDEAKLRLLLVEPDARGLGLGNRLVEECVTAAREIGYKKLTLWTNDVLDAARKIYCKAGFQLVKEEPHHSFGHDLVGQYWELDLTRAANRPKHYLLCYDVVPDYQKLREPLRSRHLDLARKAYRRGELLLAGATGDPPEGAVLLFQGPSPSVAEAFAAEDPYVSEGLVVNWSVREWVTVVGRGVSG